MYTYIHAYELTYFNHNYRKLHVEGFSSWNNSTKSSQASSHKIIKIICHIWYMYMYMYTCSSLCFSPKKKWRTNYFYSFGFWKEFIGNILSIAIPWSDSVSVMTNMLTSNHQQFLFKYTHVHLYFYHLNFHHYRL